MDKKGENEKNTHALKASINEVPPNKTLNDQSK